MNERGREKEEGRKREGVREGRKREEKGKEKERREIGKEEREKDGEVIGKMEMKGD